MSAVFEIACKGCSYCSDRCPMDLPIPKYFALYNAYLKADNGKKQNVIAEYEAIAEPGKRASDCLRCGQCEGFCPEHLPVMGFLQDIAEEIEDY